MNDDITVISSLKQMIREFADMRDWEQFHNPKDLALALTIEVSEMLEYFRFQTNEQITQVLADPKIKREFSHELADAFYFLLRLADIVGIDMTSALAEKILLLEKKYPVELVKGKPFKYDYYDRHDLEKREENEQRKE